MRSLWPACCLLLLGSVGEEAVSFLMTPRTANERKVCPGGGRSLVRVWMSGWTGRGRVGDRYWWTETENELEVVVPVPPGTTKDAVLFQAGVRSLKLGLAGSRELLLGGELKGRIALDGSYWSLETDEDGSAIEVRILLEKKGGAPENAIDWRRVLADEAATETSYGPPAGQRPWQVDQYVEQLLGPDGVNMSLVDRSMFGAGEVLGNVSKASLKAYVDQGVLADGVTRVPGSSEGQEEEDEDEDDEP